jgi:hypothetical protein
MTNSSALPRGVLRSVLLFAVAQAVLVFGMSLVLSRFVWTDAESARAIQASAWLAMGTQVITFAIAKLVARQQVIAGWGLGVVLRFAMVAFWAFLGIKALGLAASPALLSLVAFFFVSTLIEPLFLNA